MLVADCIPVVDVALNTKGSLRDKLVKPLPSPTKEPVNEDPVKLVPIKFPLALILPVTCRASVGLVVPIPILPEKNEGRVDNEFMDLA